MFSKSALVLAGAFLFSSQSFAWDKMEGVAKAEAKGVIAVTATWIKDKKDKYDVNLKLMNESGKTILMFVGDTKCGRGADMGGKVDIHSDRRSIDLRSGESREMVLTCRFDKKMEGDFSISLKVFDNPSNDSNTPGKVLAEKLVWKQGEKEGKVL